MPVLRVAFCHPDLGLGGAERLIVDAAVELAEHGHLVNVYTAHHDPKRCFKETVGGPFTVLVAGDWFPRHVLGALHALCAYIRCLLAACYIVWRSYRLQKQYDVIIVDLVSVVIPVLRWSTQAKVLFYCHFPDLLLVQRRSWLRSVYRWPLNAAEEFTTGQADKLLVNSQFTQGVFADTFASLAKRGIIPDVLYPAVPVPSHQELQAARDSWPSMVDDEGLRRFLQGHTVFLSINRFERKKDLALAVLAFSALQKRLGLQSTAAAANRLVLAGGYDTRLAENREYFQELKQLVQQLRLGDQVWLLRSFSDQQRTALLAACHAVIYTPQREHFGIVPLEAMASSRPVIACNSGGPMESVLHGKTGFLCEPSPEQFAAAMAALLEDQAVKDMGDAARSHVMKTFSRTAFGNKLHTLVSDLCKHRQSI